MPSFSTLVLDTGPLGLISNPRGKGQAHACNQWLQAQLVAGRRVVIPELADYEVRRELIRANKLDGLQRLNEMCEELEYLPLDTATMRTAARLWAEVRQQGRPTAPNLALDGDVILAAQALHLSQALGEPVLVATTNTAHLSRFVAADYWERIL